MALIGVPQVQRIHKFFSDFKGHDGAAATPGAAGSPRFCWFSPVLLVLPGSHGHVASRVPWPSVLWAATGGGSRGGGSPAWGGHWTGGAPVYGGSRREPS